MPVLDVLDLVLDLMSAADVASPWPRKTRRWFRKRVSASWPMARATVLSTSLQKSGLYYVVSAPYSFYSAGDRYGGRYQREFAGEWEAQEVLQRLLGSALMVRYKPQHPDTSVPDEV